MILADGRRQNSPQGHALAGRTEGWAAGLRLAHLKHVYRKLAVTHRGEAVRRARQLGLI